jgi:hypothetical protein
MASRYCTTITLLYIPLPRPPKIQVDMLAYRPTQLRKSSDAIEPDIPDVKPSRLHRPDMETAGEHEGFHPRLEEIRPQISD